MLRNKPLIKCVEPHNINHTILSGNRSDAFVLMPLQFDPLKSYSVFDNPDVTSHQLRF